jgi:hypothetical protein
MMAIEKTKDRVLYMGRGLIRFAGAQSLEVEASYRLEFWRRFVASTTFGAESRARGTWSARCSVTLLGLRQVLPIADETDTFLILDDGRSVGVNFPSQLLQPGKAYVCTLGDHDSLTEVSFSGDA